jgi:hypothetical protein
MQMNYSCVVITVDVCQDASSPLLQSAMDHVDPRLPLLYGLSFFRLLLF